jgi:DNA invertase Pin-like site-specific DNA recombinase
MAELVAITSKLKGKGVELEVLAMKGKDRGWVPTAQRKAPEVVRLRAQGVKPEEIATKLGISRASVLRVLKD